MTFLTGDYRKQDGPGSSYNDSGVHYEFMRQNVQMLNMLLKVSNSKPRINFVSAGEKIAQDLQGCETKLKLVIQ